MKTLSPNQSQSRNQRPELKKDDDEKEDGEEEETEEVGLLDEEAAKERFEILVKQYKKTR